MDPSLDTLADQILAEFQNAIEKNFLPQCISNKKTISDAFKQIEALKEELDNLSKTIDKTGCSFFGLTNDKDGLKPAEDLLMESTNELSNLNANLGKLKEEKRVTVGQLTEANSKFDSMKEQLNQKDIKKELEYFKSGDSYRILSQMMRTKFTLNNKLQCVSLLLDDDGHRVSGAIRVDKENQSDEELRSSVWAKFYRSCS